jgi:hypothetical protein
VIEGVTAGLKELFNDDPVSEDTRVSMFAYNLNVTLPAKYARNLVKPSSRKLYKGTTPAEEAAWEKRMAILAEHGLPDDLLAPGAPGVDVDLLNLIRKPIIPGTTDLDIQYKNATIDQMEEYAKHADDPIENLEIDGFELATVDGRKFNTTHRYQNASDGNVQKGLLGSMLPVNRDYCIYTGCPRDKDLYKYLLVPNARKDETLREFIQTGTSGKISTYINSTIPLDELIGCTGLSTAIMPILAGSNNRDELLNHMRYYNASLRGNTRMSTAVDEPLLWAYRLLSPNYSNVWEVADFPAKYHSTTEKRLIFYAGTPLQGNVQLTDARLATAVCKEMIKDGIDIYMLGESGDIGTQALGLSYKECAQADKYPDRVKIFANGTASAAWLSSFNRQYHVRLL